MADWKAPAGDDELQHNLTAHAAGECSAVQEHKTVRCVRQKQKNTLTNLTSLTILRTHPQAEATWGAAREKQGAADVAKPARKPYNPMSRPGGNHMHDTHGHSLARPRNEAWCAGVPLETTYMHQSAAVPAAVTSGHNKQTAR